MEEISMKRELLPFMAALLTTTALSYAAAAATCAVPPGVVLPDTTITAVQSVPAGTFMAQSNLPAFCRVTGLSKRTPTSNINFEVWMPSSGWNGRYEQVGNGGLAGSIVYSGMAIALREGYATASTDDGTAGDIPGFLTDFEKVADWRVYAVHETAENAKAIVRAVYGRPAHHSYFTGCSKGGSEASSEIQRYPDEFDGVVGGAAAFNGVHNQVDTLWHIVQVNGSAANTTPVLAEGPRTILHNAVIKACGRQDGGRRSDNYLNDPQDCHFNPAVLQCNVGQDPSTCLTAAEVEAAKNLYDGPRNPRTGERIFPGVPRGQEAPPGTSTATSGNLYGWQGWSPIPPPGFWVGGSLTAPTVGGLLGIANYSYADFFTFDFDKDTATLEAKYDSVYNNTNVDIQPFKSHGGKTIFYQGWGDVLVNPVQQIDYYNSVVRAQGSLKKTRDFYRLFMAPGMGHCFDGPGPNIFNGANNPGNPVDAQDDVVAAVVRWVEQGVPPDKIIASHFTNGVADVSRPLCPYPEVAMRKAAGSASDASNFVCVGDLEQAGQ
jgi:feruloyl esterase